MQPYPILYCNFRTALAVVYPHMNGLDGDGQPLAQAVYAPGWVLGLTRGDYSDNLKMESRFDPAVAAEGLPRS